MAITTAYEIEVDPLAVGLTRPAMLMGVPAKLGFFNLMFSLMFCVDTHTFYGVPVFIALHIILLQLATRDANFFKVYWTSLTQTPPVLHSAYWGNMNSYAPW